MALAQRNCLCAWSLAVIFLVTSVGAFEDLVLHQPAPIGMVRDPQNGCFYIVFRRTLLLACGNSRYTVTAERELNGYSIVTWIDHVDDSGYFIFLANHASGSERKCGIYATNSARTLSQSQPSAFAVAPELMLTCMDTNARSKNAIYLSDRDNKSLYFIAVNSTETSQAGLFNISIETSGSPVQRSTFLATVPTGNSPSFAFVEPATLAMRISNGLEESVVTHRLNGEGVSSSQSGSASGLGLSGPALVHGPVPGCHFAEIYWIYETSDKTLLVVFDVDGYTALNSNVIPQLPIVDIVQYGCNVGAAFFEEITSQGKFTPNLNESAITSFSFQAQSPDEVFIIRGTSTSSPVIVTRSFTTGATAAADSLAYELVSPNGTAVAAAGDLLFSYTIVRGNYLIVVLPARDLSAEPATLIVPSLGSLCDRVDAFPTGMAALQMSSTKYALTLQLAEGLHVLLLNVTGDAPPYTLNWIGTPVPLFPEASYPSPPFAIIGSSVIQNINDTHLLISAASVLTGSSPAVSNFAGNSRLLTNERPLGCPTAVAPRSVLVTPSGNQGLMLYNVPSNNTYGLFSIFSLVDGSIYPPLSDISGPVSMPTPFYGQISPGDLPGFASDQTVSFMAPSPTEYFGYEFSNDSLLSLSGTAFVNPSTTFRFARSPTARQLAFPCLSSSFCVYDLNNNNLIQSRSGVFNNAPLIAILSLDTGSFLAYQAADQNYQFLPSGVASWSGLQGPGPIYAAWAWPNIDAYIFVISSGATIYLWPQTPLGNFSVGLVAFQCPTCINFQLHPRTSSGKVLFTYQQYNTGNAVVIASLDTTQNPLTLKQLKFLENDTILDVVFFAGDTYFVRTTGQMLFIRFDGTNEEIIAPVEEPMLRQMQTLTHRVVRTNLGGYVIATTASEVKQNELLPRAIVLDKVICRINSDCPSPSSCDGLVCRSPPASSTTPVARPTPSPISLLLPVAFGLVCPPPAPFGATCINGIWVINSNVSSGGAVNVTAPVFINGSLVLLNNASLTLLNNASITVAGCVTVGGDVTVQLDSSSLQSSGSVTLITFDGYCGGVTSTFNSTNVVVNGAPSCAKISSSSSYNDRSISLLYNYDTSGCNAPSVSLQALSTGAIIGIVVAVVAAIAITLAVVFIVRLRNKVMPYQQRRGGDTTTQELE